MVTSVAFSPDSMRIVSASNDRTIRVWDAQTGQLTVEPLKWHTRGVTSVAFSPDGMRIVSGSYDDTIRVWDAQAGQMTLGSVEGHTHSDRSVKARST
jgi:WD40 repeat protein